MSANGTRVFFDSEQPLVPQDTNDVQDVYEWEQAGEGTCTSQLASPLNDGCVFLISGNSRGYSFLVDADSNGDNVFFEHEGALGGAQVSTDRNELYDARVNGRVEESAPAQCSAEACKGPIIGPPVPPSAGSSQFSGPGNIKPKHKKKHHKQKRNKRHRRHAQRSAKHNRGGSK